jgi:threonine dehydratase
VKRVVDRVVTVDEASIALAILRLIELEKSVVEGAGATPLAAFLGGSMRSKGRGRAVLAGGNIDSSALGRVIGGPRRRWAAGRFSVSISDRPGGLAPRRRHRRRRRIDQGSRSRPRIGPDLSAVRVVCVAETTGHAHVKRLHDALDAAG